MKRLFGFTISVMLAFAACASDYNPYVNREAMRRICRPITEHDNPFFAYAPQYLDANFYVSRAAERYIRQSPSPMTRTQIDSVIYLSMPLPAGTIYDRDILDDYAYTMLHEVYLTMPIERDAKAMGVTRVVARIGARVRPYETGAQVVNVGGTPIWWLVVEMQYQYYWPTVTL